MGFDWIPPRGELIHSAAAIVSNAAAVALSATPLWVSYLSIDIDDDNPTGPTNKALFGSSSLTAASWGLGYYAGDKFQWPFPGPIPVHQIYYYQIGGAGEVRWMAMRRQVP